MIGAERYQATNLEAVLTEQGRMRRWLAQRIGVSESWISKVLAGQHTVDRDQGEQIGRILGVPFFVVFELRDRSEHQQSSEDAA